MVSASTKAHWVRICAARVYSRLQGSTIRVNGHGNQLTLADTVRRGCRIQVHGNRNRIEFEPGCRLWNLNLEIVGDDHHLQVGPDCAIRGGHWLLEDKGSRISIGAGTTMIEDRLVASEGASLTFGADCMLGANVEVRCSDGHSIVEQATGGRINPAADISIGEHVWLGIGVRVLKGVVVERDSVVAAQAVVTRDLPRGCVAAGIPARVIRSGVTWNRARLPARDSTPVSCEARVAEITLPSADTKSIGHQEEPAVAVSNFQTLNLPDLRHRRGE